VASGSEHYIGKVISSCAQNGEDLGGEADGKSCVARGSGVCYESRYRQVSAARPPPDLRTALPRRRRRTGADPVSARSRFHSDNRTISRLQTAHSRCRQRQNRNRAIWLNEPLTVRFADYPLDRAIHHQAGQETLAQMPTLQSSKCSWVSNHSTSSRRYLSRSTRIVIPITMSNASRLRGFNRRVLLIKLVILSHPFHSVV